MSVNTSKAGAMSAIAQGTQGLVRGIEGRPAAQLAKKQAEQKMDQLDYQDETGAWKAQIDALTAQNKQIVGDRDQQKLYRNLRYFTETQEVKYLNDLLSQDIFKTAGIARFDTIDKVADAGLIAQAGMDIEDLDDTAYGGAGDSQRFVKRIMQDGTVAIQDLYKVKQMSGYYKDLDKQRTAEELRLNEDTKGKTYSPSEMEKTSKYLTSQGHGTEKNISGKLMDKKTSGTAPGLIGNAEERAEILQSKFGGDFIKNFDPYDPQQREMAYADIAAIEKFEGVEFSSSERKEMRDISVLLAMGDPGKEMSADETGIIDSLVTDVKRYVSNDGGSEAVSAYAAFRNSLRHALYGSALTDSEIKSFNEQFGTRKQQLTPLLKQMKTAMEQVRGKLNSIYSMQNPFSAKFRIGASQEDADRIIAALDERITLMSDIASGKATELTPEAQADKDQRIIGDVWK